MFKRANSFLLRMTTKIDNNLAFFVIGSFIAIIAFFCGVYLSSLSPEKDDFDRAVKEGLVLWPNPPSIANFHLNDHHGDSFTHEDLSGKWTMLFFGFTNCPDVCPSTLNILERAHQTLLSESGETPVQTVFVSVDPERDTTDALNRYVQHFSEHLIGVTGTRDQLTALTKSVGALFLIGPQSNTNAYTVDHSAGIFFISPTNNLLSVLTPPVSKMALLERLRATQLFFAKTDL